MKALRQWLEHLGLSQYAEVFAGNDVDLEALCLLTDAELEKLGVSLGHRKKLLKAIARLHSAGAPELPADSIQEQQPARLEPASADAERRQLTVLFCDLVGSTELATALDPEQLRDLMQSYQNACGDVVKRYEGHIAQYLGDGLMVYFGWPRAHEDAAVRAIRAGMEMTESVSELRTARPIQARVGVHTGLVVVGETGHGDASIPKAAVGDTPNIAARLQALADPGRVVVSERTQALAPGLFNYADLGAQYLKGCTEPMHVFHVVDRRAVSSRFEAARGEAALTPLVGREEELSLLLRRWRQATDGEGQVVLIGGEAGIGKSRLARALRERLGEERHVLLRYQCSAFHVHSALYPVIEQLERAAGFHRADSTERKLDRLQAVLTGTPKQVADASPLFAALLSLPTGRYSPLNLSPQKQKEKTLEALAEQVEALAQRQPLLLIYEDAHWIDATSQEALDLLVPRLRELPVLAIVTYRPEYNPRWSDQAHVTTLGVNRLGRRQVVELVANLTAGKVLPQEVHLEIVSHTDGVPLFVEELTKSVLESGLLRESGDCYTLLGPLPPLAIPTSLRDSLLARLDRLGSVKEVAQLGACLGREFSFELLGALSSLSRDELEQSLKKLVDAGLVFRRGTPPEATYTFKHALVQDAAYDSLLKSKRSTLHAQIAHVLERNFPERVFTEPQLLAHHHTRAGHPMEAIPLWRRAGELAVHRAGLQEAIGHFQNGLLLIEQLPSSSERDALELSIREPLTAAWTWLRGFASPELGVNASAMLGLAKDQGKPQSLLMGLYGVFVNTIAQGRAAESLQWAQRLLTEGNEAGDRHLQITGDTCLNACEYWLGHLIEAREHGQRVVAVYDPQRARTRRWMPLAGQDVRTSVGIFSSFGTWMLGYPDQALEMVEETTAHARLLGHVFNLAWALSLGAFVFDYRCEPQQLSERAAEADHLAREQGIPFLFQSVVPVLKGLAKLRAGDLPEASSILRRQVETMGRVGSYLSLPYTKAALAQAMADQGALDDALRLIDECLDQIERPGWEERVHLAEILRLKGWMLMRQGEIDEAEEQLRASISWAKRQRAKSWELRSSTTLAELLAERGQRDAARELLAGIYSWFTEGFATHDLTHAKGFLDELS